MYGHHTISAKLCLLFGCMTMGAPMHYLHTYLIIMHSVLWIRIFATKEKRWWIFTHHALSAPPSRLICCFLAFNTVSRSCKFFVSHTVLNSSSHLSNMPLLNLSSNFFGLNLVSEALRISFTLVISLSLQLVQWKKKTCFSSWKRYKMLCVSILFSYFFD